MVREFHAAGLEVLLDVVYNHTAEGGDRGPTLAFRGIDNAAYYRLDPAHPARYLDFTGCGNTLDLRRTRDCPLRSTACATGSRRCTSTASGSTSRRCWAAWTPCSTRARRSSSASAVIPCSAAVKLIAEPWDLGPDGYQVGNFPPGWAEWNGKYRDAVRRFWRGDTGRVGELASRLAGSSDLYGPRERGPLASVNFVTCHDGFTLHDLVSYEQQAQRGQRRGEPRRQRPQPEPQLGRRGPRRRPPRSRGSASGSSGACWRPWPSRRASRCCRTATSSAAPSTATTTPTATTDRSPGSTGTLDADQRALLAFVRRVLALRAATPALRRRTFFPSTTTGGDGLTWLRADGTPMARRRLGPRREPRPRHAVRGRATPLLLLMNGGGRSRAFVLPERPKGLVGPARYRARGRAARRVGGSRSRRTLSSCSGNARSSPCVSIPSLRAPASASPTPARRRRAGAPAEEAARAQPAQLHRSHRRAAGGALRARGRRALLVVLQGRDTAGKDGTIRKVFGPLDPQGLVGHQFQGAHADRAGARLSLAGAPGGAGPGHDRRLQPLALRGRARGSGPRAGARVGLAAALRPDQQFERHADRERRHHPQVLPAHLPEGAARAAAGAAGRSREVLEVRGGRPGRARAVGRVHRGVRGGARAHQHRRRRPWYLVPADKKYLRDLLVAQVVAEPLERMDPKYPGPPEGPWSEFRRALR